MKTTIIRALTLLLTLIPHLYATAAKYDFKSDGLYYKILSEEDRTVEVTYEYDGSDNRRYVSGDIEIPRKVLYNGKTYNVTSIGSYAFYHCTGLTSVTIPNSVTSIGSSAFKVCSGLTSVMIPNSVTYIDSSAFYGCTGLTSVTIPNSVTFIWSSAFYGCTGLTSVTIPNSVIFIGDYVFQGCSGLTSVTIGNSVTSIEPSMFNGCKKLEHINVNAENINLLSIDGVVYNKDASTLLYCPSGKTAVTIPPSVISIGDSAFYGCSGLTSVTIPNSVTSIGWYAFEGCSGLTSVTTPPSVTSIGYYTFSGCSGLTSVTISNSVTSIGSYAFSHCSGLTSVTIPNSVTSIGGSAFYDCSSLETIYVQSQVPVKCDPRFSDDVLKNAILYVPTGTLAAYEKVEPWRDFWNIEEMDFSGVEETAADGLEPQISVENGIIRIGNNEGNPFVEVFDISGKNVFSGNATTVSGLAKGIYIVRVGSNVQKIRL